MSVHYLAHIQNQRISLSTYLAQKRAKQRQAEEDARSVRRRWEEAGGTEPGRRFVEMSCYCVYCYCVLLKNLLASLRCGFEGNKRALLDGGCAVLRLCSHKGAVLRSALCFSWGLRAGLGGPCGGTARATAEYGVMRG